LRVRPILPFCNLLEATEDHLLGDLKVSKGTFIYPSAIISRSEKYFKNADKFFPERWFE